MTNKTNRCNCLATTTNRKCKLSYKFIILNKKYCFIHANIYYKSRIILIQKNYRSYRIRNKLKILFYNLPRELQEKVLSYNKQDYYIKKYHHTPIRNILSKRFNNITNNILFKKIHYNTDINIEKIILYFKDYIELCNLYTKYSSISNLKDNYILYNSIYFTKQQYNSLLSYHNINPVDKISLYTINNALEISTENFNSNYIKYLYYLRNIY